MLVSKEPIHLGIIEDDQQVSAYLVRAFGEDEAKRSGFKFEISVTDDVSIANSWMSKDMIDHYQNFPFMDGPAVFKKAIVKFPEVIMEALQASGFTAADLDLLIPHQANLRIAQFVQQKLQLRNDQVYNNIQQYGNTTAASIPIALTEAWELGKIKSGDVVVLAAFGSGFTWASAIIKW